MGECYYCRYANRRLAQIVLSKLQELIETLEIVRLITKSNPSKKIE